MLESSLELSADEQNLGAARIFVGLRDNEEAFSRLEDSRFWGDPHVDLNAQHWLAPLRDDPRYKAKLRHIVLEP
jgi:hypothetical protein